MQSFSRKKTLGGEEIAATGAFANGWELDDSSIINKIKNTSLKRQLAEATDPEVIQQLQVLRFTLSPLLKPLPISNSTSNYWLNACANSHS